MPLNEAQIYWGHLWKNKKQKKKNQWISQNFNVTWRNVKTHWKGETKITSRYDIIITTWFWCLSLMVFPVGVVDVVEGMDFNNGARWCQMFDMSWMCPYFFNFCFMVGIHSPYFLLVFKERFLNPFWWKLYLLLETYPLKNHESSAWDYWLSPYLNLCLDFSFNVDLKTFFTTWNHVVVLFGFPIVI
jgi:hypothetical protein